jgi:hypothetical protein
MREAPTDHSLLVGEDRFVPGEESWVRTLCQQCAAGCGITVRVMQGESIRTVDGQQKRVKAVQAKKIEGNPEHPISMGGTCARGQAGVQALYHPDRIRTPLKRSGPRGSGQYQPISWKDAQQLLVAQLEQQLSTPAAVALLTGRSNRGTMGAIVERFAAGLGTPNLVTYDPFDPAPIRTAMELVLITYETTMLGAVLGTLVGLLVELRLPNFKNLPYDGNVVDGGVVIAVSCPEGSRGSVEAAVGVAGASKVNWV